MDVLILKKSHVRRRLPSPATGRARQGDSACRRCDPTTAHRVCAPPSVQTVRNRLSCAGVLPNSGNLYDSWNERFRYALSMASTFQRDPMTLRSDYKFAAAPFVQVRPCRSAENLPQIRSHLRSPPRARCQSWIGPPRRFFRDANNAFHSEAPETGCKAETGQIALQRRGMRVSASPGLCPRTVSPGPALTVNTAEAIDFQNKG